ncbi:MKI67 FHA domain-interacting nucleolar phosphoprotein-like [Lytechinus variegatus]|uniref:MKI67 FHA domain-interacting nucleolar phosphoprotein-like n=1 Tax=Lytechinus variegatus TaxID=7654 RepID=UPI001BB1B778|nr:MKI67 FHA domain-interacting nucleolar phosphoprotein-like [Lytechinus variegatus]
MASLKPRRRHGVGEAGLKALDAEMQRTFSMKMGQLKRMKRDIHEDDPNSGVVYVSHIPHGFFEPQMKKFFSQFGNIKRLRLSRSKKSGRSKGYAYIEFEYDEVAKVVTETMHNYLMYQKLLKCFYVPKDKLHPDTFKGCFHHFKSPRRREIAASRNNSLLESGKDHILESQKRRVRGLNKKQKKLQELGIDFKIEGVDSEWKRLQESLPPAPKLVPPVKASKVTAKPPSRSRKPAAKQEQKENAKRKMSKPKTSTEKSTNSKSKKKLDADSDDATKVILAVPAKKRKQEKEGQTSTEKRKVIKKTESKDIPEGKVQRKVKKGAQSAKVSSKVRAAKGVRTAGKKSKRLSL